MVSALCLHYSVSSTLAELEQLHRGLTFTSLMETHPELIHSAFYPPETKICSDLIQDMLTPEFSPTGSNRRSKEEAIVVATCKPLKVTTLSFMFVINTLVFVHTLFHNTS